MSYIKYLMSNIMVVLFASFAMTACGDSEDTDADTDIDTDVEDDECNGDENTIFFADFSADCGYSDGEIMGQPAGAALTWVTPNPDHSSAFLVQDEAMMVVIPDGNAYFLHMPFPVTDGTMVLTYDTWLIGHPDETVVEDNIHNMGLSVGDSANYGLETPPDPLDGIVINYSELGAISRIDSSGFIDARNGDGIGGGEYAAAVEFDYTDGVTTTIRMVIRVGAFDNGWGENDISYDVYAQKEGESEVTLATDFGFRLNPGDVTGGLDSIALWSTQHDFLAAGTRMMVDNIHLRTE